MRIVAVGDTQIDQVKFESGGTIEGQGIAEVYVLKPGEEVILDGDFEKVVPEANAEVKVIGGTTIEKLEIAEKAKQAKVDIAENCIVKTLTLNAPAQITSKGKIEKAEINTNGAVIEQKPEKVEVAESVKTNVGGKEVSEGTTTSLGGSIGGDRGGGSTQQEKVAIDHIAVTNLPTKIIYNVGVSFDLSGLAVAGTYSDGSIKEETITIANITGFYS